MQKRLRSRPRGGQWEGSFGEGSQLGFSPSNILCSTYMCLSGLVEGVVSTRITLCWKVESPSPVRQCLFSSVVESQALASGFKLFSHCVSTAMLAT